MSQNPVDIIDLHKSFGSVKALDGLQLTVRPGEVAGFLGPNGAGKSTTIRVLLGLQRPDSGTAKLFGGDAWNDAVALHRRLAYVPGDVSLWPNLTGGEAIDYLTRLHTTSGNRAQLKRRKAALLEHFELDPTKKARTYSKGNRQKVALVAAFLVDPELYIFDEPTSGLDPLMEAVFTDNVQQVKNAGKSVLLSSHILSEVEKLCDTVTIIRSGRTVESGTLAELRHLTRTTVSVLVAQDPAAITTIPGVHDVTTTVGSGATRVDLSVDNARMGAVLTALTRLDVRGLTATPPSLEELFMRHYGSERDLEAVSR
ncbi:ABC transporter ATP-binding protein [Actinoplanes siamensis]|uniref:Tetronasin ABC transporter ATP-binding protein n=1 Tax=Actinoplanes siamensis TaxID=1223317 RepID=A0A919N594_9ACTN|nr:ABC transporter ATP-binding protein [Actinoplanes siamensis]GIF04591.1 tetronasin ABC transporter ATP-binding protein [Actinoplanes siamensis]